MYKNCWNLGKKSFHENDSYGLNLASTDRLGLAAQVGGSGIRASVITRDVEGDYIQKDFQISNDHGRGIHVLFDLFATVAKVANNVAEVVANISWAGTHRGDLGDSNKMGEWNHSNFDVERFQDEKTRYPIPIDQLLLHKLATGATREDETLSRSLVVKNGMQSPVKLNDAKNGKTFNLKIFHDPHASLLHAARNNTDLQKTDNYGVLIGGTGNNVWLGENWDPQNREFETYYQTRFGRRPNMFTLEEQLDDIRTLEPFRFDALQSKLKQIFNEGTTLSQTES